jgi:hypothetical protein
MKRVELGSEVKDKVTGFRGIAIGRSEFLNGCARIGVQAKVGKDGSVKDAVWFDEPQLEIIVEKKIKCGLRNTGGPAPSTPTRTANPR